MRMTWPGSWLRYTLACVGLVIVIAGWVIASLAALVASIAVTAIPRVRVRFAFSLPSAQFWLRLGAALFVAFLFVVWFVVAITYPFPPLLTFASIPILTYVLLLIAQGPEYSDPFEGPSRPASTARSRFSWISSRRNLLPAPDYQHLTRGHDVFSNRNLIRDPLWDRWIDG
jgi:hypothetical protein